MTALRKGHLVRHVDDARRHGRIVSAEVQGVGPREWGMVLVEWLPSGRVTQINPGALVLDDHPLRGRNVVLEHAADDWMEML
jgi:hypothetical protein